MSETKPKLKLEITGKPTLAQPATESKPPERAKTPPPPQPPLPPAEPEQPKITIEPQRDEEAGKKLPVIKIEMPRPEKFKSPLNLYIKALSDYFHLSKDKLDISLDIFLERAKIQTDAS